MKRIFILLTVTLITLAASTQTLLDTATNFFVKDIDGLNHELFEILGQNKYVVVNFYSTACGTCQQHGPEMQQAYLEFGCNEGNVFFISIDKGNWNEDVIFFNNEYGIEYPSISGMEGNGNITHLDYEIQGTPSIVMIAPDKSIPVRQVFPGVAQNIIDSVAAHGGIAQTCGVTAVNENGISKNSFSFYPNPASEFVTFGATLKKRETIYIEIYDLMGKLVSKTGPALYKEGISETSISVSHLANGIYIGQIRNGETNLESKKIIIDR
ncbi:MAG: T9SS type A sorting domain-containing protein [Bacteroidales bacterium]|nr:T9SS type A sorting domain-containing protein [Bacteroidales bacterium]